MLLCCRKCDIYDGRGPLQHAAQAQYRDSHVSHDHFQLWYSFMIIKYAPSPSINLCTPCSPIPIYPAALAFFFLSSISSILSSGTSLYFSRINSSISSLTSPCTTISSPPLASFVTLLPVANFFPKSFATFLLSRPNASRPETAVTYFRLLRSTRLI